MIKAWEKHQRTWTLSACGDCETCSKQHTKWGYRYYFTHFLNTTWLQYSDTHTGTQLCSVRFLHSLLFPPASQQTLLAEQSLCTAPSESMLVVTGHSVTIRDIVSTIQHPHLSAEYASTEALGGAETVQRTTHPSRKVKTRLPDCRVSHKVLVDHCSRLPGITPSLRTLQHKAVRWVVEDVNWLWTGPVMLASTGSQESLSRLLIHYNRKIRWNTSLCRMQWNTQDTILEMLGLGASDGKRQYIKPS